MSYHTTDVWGVTEIMPDAATMRMVLRSLDDADIADHPDVALVHESGWSLTYGAGGVLVWENYSEPDTGYPRYMHVDSETRVLELWQMLAAGKIAELERLPWREDE